MQLTLAQTQELLKIIDGNQLAILGSELGEDFLTEYDKQLLTQNGVDYKKLYSPELSSITTSFHFGMLTEALGKVEINKISYNDLKLFVRQGKYLSVSPKQIATLNSIRVQTFTSLKALNGNIFADINNVLVDKTRYGQQEFLANETRQGLEKKQTVSQIAHEIARKTGDWSRNFDRIIETAAQTAFETGKAAEIERRNPAGSDPLVGKRVYQGACKHCIRLYLTAGLGSQPIIFKLSELRANGSNIGRTVSEWKATIDALHPHCRCSLFEIPEGFLWNKETQSFSTPDPAYSAKIAATRQLVRVTIGGKEYFV